MKLWSVVLLCSTLTAGSAHATDLRCSDLPDLFGVFMIQHYAAKSLGQDEIRTRTVEQFIKELDPTHTLLLEEDVASLRRELPAVFLNMRKGDCSLLTGASQRILARATLDEALSKEVLGSSYKLDESVELILDAEKRGYAKSPDERAVLVNKMIHFQVSNHLMAGVTLDAAKKLVIHRYELVAKRLQQREAKGKLPEMYAEAYAEALDPHTSFMSADTLADFQIQMRLSLEGIGAVLTSQDGLTIIESLVPGGQAEKTKQLQPKDKIMAVAQEGDKPVSIMDMDLQEVVKMIRGKKGTKVTLTVLRDGAQARSFEVTIVRDKIDVKEQAAKMTIETRNIEGQPQGQPADRSFKVGVLDLPSFYGDGEAGGRSSYTDVKKLLIEARAQKVDGIVLDLSRNGGGLLEDAVRISGLFIKRGAVVATKNAAGKVEVLADLDDDVVYSGPLVVLISAVSASASEILAGALRDYARAVIVGSEHTFGKGTVQLVMPLPDDLGAVKITTAMFFLPGGASTQQRGVASDIRVPSMIDGFKAGDKLLDYSLPPQTISAFLSSDANSADANKRWKPVTPLLLATLAAKSKERVAADPQFGEIRKLLDEAEKNNGVVKLAELRKTAKQMGPDEAAQNTKSKQLEATFKHEAVNVLVDLAML